jgi:LssY C-terminus
MIDPAPARTALPGRWLLAVLLAATGIAFASETPPPDYRARAVTRSDGQVRVSASVLSADESLATYGVPLAERRIQPVWIEVENKGTDALWLLSSGLDPNFFPPSEAAEAFAGRSRPTHAGGHHAAFRALAFHNPVPPGATVSGFVLTNLHEGVKLVQVDLVGNARSHTFSIVTTVPGLKADYEQNAVFQREVYTADQVTDYADDASFRAALESLPCCVTNASGSKTGDPLNLIVVGGIDDAFPSFIRRGWSPTEATWFGSVMRMITSALAGDRYPYAPVSNLYLLGRPQDIALQKARDTIHQRNHLRLWQSPMRYHGRTVWIGQISRDIGSRMTIHSPTLTTHKIDPDVDKAVMALLGDLMYSQNLQKFAFVKGVGAATRDSPKRNLTTDPWYTNGLRVVLFFDRKPTPISEIEILPWETTSEGVLQPGAVGKGK